MPQTYFYILIRAWNSFDNFDRCIDSVLKQNYKSYRILFVDDHSPLSNKEKSYIRKKLQGHVVVFNKKRQYSLKNAYMLIHKYATKDEAVVFNLDADDWLPHKRCLDLLAKEYQKKDCLVSYGNCLVKRGRQPAFPAKSGRNIKYNKETIKKNSYRSSEFLPLHPLSWKVWLFKKIRKKDLLDPDGKWLRFAQDLAIFYPLLEMAAGKFSVLRDPIYVYHKEHRYSDYNFNFLNMVKDELTIRRKKPYEPIS